MSYTSGSFPPSRAAAADGRSTCSARGPADRQRQPDLRWQRRRLLQPLNVDVAAWGSGVGSRVLTGLGLRWDSDNLMSFLTEDPTLCSVRLRRKMSLCIARNDFVTRSLLQLPLIPAFMRSWGA